MLLRDSAKQVEDASGWWEHQCPQSGRGASRSRGGHNGSGLLGSHSGLLVVQVSEGRGASERRH